MKILTRKYLLGRVAHGSGGHYCFISPIQHIMHYFTQNMPTTPLQQETSHIRMPLDARSMGSARQTGHTPHSRTSRSFIQKARGQYCFISPTQHTMHYFTQNTPPNPTTKGTLYRVPSGQDPWVLPAKPDIPPMAAPPLPPHLKG